MSHVCYTCGKNLSSQQALNYHTSRSCKKTVNECDTLTKLSKTCHIHITCQTNGTITAIVGDVRDVEYIGFLVYAFLSDISHQYCFAMHHIRALTNEDNQSCHNFFVNDITKKTCKLLRTVILKVDKKMHVFQFKHDGGDLKNIHGTGEKKEPRRGSSHT